MSMLRRCLVMLLVLPLISATARAQIPAFTPNVVDPHHYLTDADREQVNGFIESVRHGADIAAAVYLTDHVGDESIEELANKAFATWKLGEKSKDNGLLLVLAMEDRKMRIETGYGLEGDLPDVVCLHALDEQMRPRLREKRIAQGVIDAFYVLARKRVPSFSVEGQAPPAPPTPAAASRSRFDARAGGLAWGGWIALLAWLCFRKRGGTARGRIGLFAFLSLNPGLFIFIGVALLSQQREAVARAVGGFVLGHLILVPFYGLVAVAAIVPLRRYLWLSFEKQRELCEAHPKLAELEEQLRRLTGSARPFAPSLRGGSIAIGIVSVVLVLVLDLALDLDYRQPPFFLVPAALFGFGWMLMQRGLRRLSSADTLRTYFEDRIRRQRERMERLVRIGHATRRDDGTYSYTAAYYASQASSSSSSSSSDSSWSSSSGGGSSGGGGASSDW